MLDHTQGHSANNENEGERRQGLGRGSRGGEEEAETAEMGRREDWPAKLSRLGMEGKGNQTIAQGTVQVAQFGEKGKRLGGKRLVKEREEREKQST